MTRNILLVLTLIGAVGLAVWLWRNDDAPSVPAPDTGASLDAPGSTGPTGQATPAPRPAVPLPPSPDFGSAAFNAEVARQNAETGAGLEKIWAADHTDAAQTQEIERNLVEKAGSKSLLEVRDQPSKIVSIGCRSTMCRIEMSFPSGSSPSEWSSRMLIEMSPAFQTSTQVNMPGEKGESTVVLYAFRPGGDPRR